MYYFGSSFIKIKLCFDSLLYRLVLFLGYDSCLGITSIIFLHKTLSQLPVLMSQFGQSKFIKQRLDEKEITNFNSLKLNIKKIWRELDSGKAFC